MKESPRETVERVSGRLAVLLESTRGALRGVRDFDATDIRALGEAIGEMDLLTSQWKDMQRSEPKMAEPMARYKAQLSELQTTLVQIRILLESRQTGLGISQAHNIAVSRWASAFQQTR